MFIKTLIPIYIIYLYNFFYYAFKYKNLKISQKSFLNNVKLWKWVMICWWAKLDFCEIGDYTYISWSEAGGISSRFKNVKIWKFCSIAHNVEVINNSHYTNHVSTYPFISSKNSPFYKCNINISDSIETNTIIWNDVWIWAHVKIIWDIIIWDGAIIAAWSVVTKNIEPYTIVWWIPAKVIKKRFSDSFISYLLKLSWWDKEEKSIYSNLLFINSSEWWILWQD